MKTMIRSSLILIPAFIALLSGLGLFSLSQAAVANTNNMILVTTEAVEVDENDGQCSLREAIINANKNQAISNNLGECPAGSAIVTDEILLANGATYALTADGNDAETGDLDIFNNSEIDLDIILMTADSGSAATIDASAINNRVIEVTIDATAVISNVIIRGGSTLTGAGLFSSGGTVTVTHSNIQNNNGLTGGGVANFDGRITLIDSQVILNTASQSGGALYNAGPDAQMFVINSFVRANTAEGLYGGGIINDKGHVVIEQNSFVNLNRSKLDGGGIYTVEGSVTISDSTLEGNEAGYTDIDTADGGAIFSPANNTSSELTIHNSSIINNKAFRMGGGIYGLELTMTNSIVSANKAGDGGGLHISIANLTDVELTKNESTIGVGGGMYVEHLIGTALNVHDNHSQGNGGGIWTDKIELSHSQILSNTSQGNGGGIYFRTGTGEISSSVIALNTAEKNGAGVWAAGDLTFANTTVSSNRTNFGKGGGIYIDETGTVKAINMTIALNSPGLDVYKAGEMTLQNSLISTPDTPNCFLVATPIISLGNNISDDASCDGLTESTDQYTPAATILEPLTDNGGDTLTHALGHGSPAIDAGNNTACQAALLNNVDQRGLPRDAVGPACDVGAFEVAHLIMLPLVAR